MENLSRRNAIKAIGMAPAILTAMTAVKVGIDKLIEEHSAVRAALTLSYRQEDALYEVIGKPEFPSVSVTELPRQYHLFGSDRQLVTINEIGKFFDYHENFHFGNGFISEEIAAPRRAAMQKDRAAALNLFAGRQAKYQRWCLESGLTAVEDQSRILGDKEDDLDSRILAWNCETIEDVRAKAGYIARVYDDNMSQEALTAFVKGLLPKLA